MSKIAMLKGKKLEAARAIAAANPTWSEKHVYICADFLMPTTTEHFFDQGSAKRRAAEQLFKERMHAFLVEMNIITEEQAYVRPDDWQSPYEPASRAPSQRQTRPSVPQGSQSAAPKEPRPAGEIREPREGSAGAKAWAICDDIYAEKQRCPTPAEAGDEAVKRGLNPGNVRTEVSRWRKFRGYQK